MTKIVDGVEVTSYDDEPPILVEGTVDGRVFMLRLWKDDWDFRVADALVDLRMGIEPSYIERSLYRSGPWAERGSSGLGLVRDLIKEIIKQCAENYRQHQKEKAAK